MPRRSLSHWGLLIGAALFATSGANADRNVVHEYFEPNEQEDLLLKATTLDGSMPVAIETESGIVSAPGSARPSDVPTKAYGGTSTPNSPDAEYRVDRNTTRPDVVSYDDPFNPSIAPFKRLYAFDTVDHELELTVADKSLQEIPIGGEHTSGDDQFYGVLVVDLAKDAPVRIPSVGPGTRILSAQTSPPVQFKILRDGADNWFMRAPERKRVRLTMLLAISREVFGSPFRDASHAELTPFAKPLPYAADEAAREVAEHIGVSHAMRPKSRVEHLVSYFRGFAPSTELPRAHDAVGLYKELALSQKGVCRHRAYAFVVTAHHLGIPARMVRNEAHAWVEAYDGKRWHRIDLGGAAGDLDLNADESSFQHVPPPDPHPWPPGADRGEEMARRARDALGLQGPNTGEAPSSNPSPDPTRPSLNLSNSDRPRSNIEVDAAGGNVRRGDPLEVSGRVMAGGRPCVAARVDVALGSEGSESIPLGSLPTGNDGRFAGAVTVRLDLDVGDYDLVVSTPGTARCGPGVSE